MPKACPAYNGQHSFQDDGEVLYRTRLSSCPTFCNLGAGDRANIIQSAGGCQLCLNWTGDHQRDKCSAKTRGKPFGNCTILVNGAPCGVKHSSLIHLSTTKYCNLVQVNSTSLRVAPTLDVVEGAEAGPRALLQIQSLEVQGDGNQGFGVLGCRQ